MQASDTQLTLGLFSMATAARIHPIAIPEALPQGVSAFPQLRYMGSKHRLLPWIHSALQGLSFRSALDLFSGSGCVAYLLKRMGKEVVANDFLEFTHLISKATVENSTACLTPQDLDLLTHPNRTRRKFVERTFSGVFFDPESLRFLDNLWANLGELSSDYKRALALAAAFRACVKKQPRGVFTVTGNPLRYDDGRRDLHMPLRDLFLESAAAYNAVVFDNGCVNRATRLDAFEVDPAGFDLVYMDPPYVPRADDNCYVKRYHFLEGLASYWQAPGTEILVDTASRKIAKRFTPFSYRKTAADAFSRIFKQFRKSTLVLSYSSNGYPDLEVLVHLMRQHKSTVTVHERPHRYHFGTHDKVAKDRASVREYLIIGS